MNKSELIDAIAEKSGLSKAVSGTALDAVIASVSEALSKGDTVTLVGFGSFAVKERAARVGRNPKTGEELQIPASKVPGFRAGKGLKDAVADVKPAAKVVPAKAEAKPASKPATKSAAAKPAPKAKAKK